MLPITIRRRARQQQHQQRTLIRISPVSIVIICTLLCCFVFKANKVMRHHSKLLKALFPKPGTEQFRIRPLGCNRFSKAIKSGQHYSSIKDPNHGEVLLAKNITEGFIVSLPKPIVGNSNTKALSILKSGTYYKRQTTKLVKQILAVSSSAPTTEEEQTYNNNKNEHHEEEVEITASGNTPHHHDDTQQQDASSSSSSSSSNGIFHPSDDVRIMDVGAGFGWFSLLAKKLGYQVDVFEPNLVHSIRMCQSLDHNHWLNQGVDIYPYGLTEEDSAVLMQYDSTTGAARINDNWGHKSQAFALDTFARERKWLERNDQTIALLRLNVGNHAPQVLEGASELLSSGMVKYLLVTFTIRHKRDDKVLVQKAIQQLLKADFELLLWGDKEPMHPNPWGATALIPTHILKAMEKTKWEMTFLWKYKET